MTKEEITETVLKLNEKLYLDIEDGENIIVCYEDDDAGIDFTYNGVFIHSLQRTISYDDNSLMGQIKFHLENIIN